MERILAILKALVALLGAYLTILYVPQLSVGLVCVAAVRHVKGGPYLRTFAAFLVGWVVSFLLLNFAELALLLVAYPIWEIISNWGEEISNARAAAQAAVLAMEVEA